MSLGTGALKVGRGSEHFRPRQRGIHSNPMSGNHPCKQLPTGKVTLKPGQGKNTHLTSILTKKFWNFWREGRAGSLIRSHPGKLICNDQLESAKICINTGAYLICNDQLNLQRFAHTGKVPCQLRRGAKPLGPPRIMSHALWGLSADLRRHKPSTSIGLILTLPKLHLAT